MKPGRNERGNVLVFVTLMVVLLMIMVGMVWTPVILPIFAPKDNRRSMQQPSRLPRQYQQDFRRP